MSAQNTPSLTKYIYDQIPYPSVSHSKSHPNRLATVATLRGMEPAPVEQCRVLEVGCAGGGNLIPMAANLPESTFVGLDLSAHQIARGQAMIAALGLSNITLRTLDILEVRPDLGQFDYIIAHGVYSWVPAAVQEKLLAICRDNLAPNGVAYISYNIYPGWNMLGTIRQMMRYHTRHLADPLEQAAEARKLLDFLANSISTDSNSHGGFLYVYVNYVKEYLLPKDDSFLLHDELAEINTPVYFHEFVAQAEQHDLQYLGEVNFASMMPSEFPAEVNESLRQMVRNTIELEQYLDFLRNRMFRQSLLCHQAVPLSHRFDPERLSRFSVAAAAMPESESPDIQSGAVEKFKALDGASFSTNHPLTKAAMRHLMDVWPRAVSFTELIAAAGAQLADDGAVAVVEEEAQIVGANLLQAYSYSENLVEFHVYQPRFVTEISDYPLVSPVARYQAAHDQPVTNLRHERLTLDTMTAKLLTFVDGSRDVAGLVAALEAEDMLEFEHQDQQPLDDVTIVEILTEIVHEKLQQFAHAALLVG